MEYVTCDTVRGHKTDSALTRLLRVWTSRFLPGTSRTREDCRYARRGKAEEDVEFSSIAFYFLSTQDA
ncbi:hypothetical protein QJS04_geneDACA010504 [Acorus gramineus]|uniref:Uncharacterized protein n=1 Tax=Acorus gramineus TaxID=55184 RepID=A0AAV9AL36_ACOGR|nr:hypothetical protein QJS04_geneDACA010504 [Acorus gramineus]